MLKEWNNLSVFKIKPRGKCYYYDKSSSTLEDDKISEVYYEIKQALFPDKNILLDNIQLLNTYEGIFKLNLRRI